MKAGWQTKKLGEVCEIIMGQSPAGETYNSTGEGIPLINGPVEFSPQPFGYTVRSKFTTKPTKYCKAGDLILCVRGSTTGRMNIAGFDACIGRGVAAIRANLYQPWVNYFVRTKRQDIYDTGTGATFPNVSGVMLSDLDIAFPPVPEQQRIVGILDEAFDGIAAAKANAEKNLQNARALFESHLQAVFADAWVTGELVTLTDLATDITDGDHMPPPKASSGVPFITIGNVAKDTRTIDFSDTFMVSRDYFDRLKYHKKPMKGDVLYTVTGSFGIPVLVSEHREFCFQRHIGLVRPKSDVCSEWLYYLLMSPQVFKQANDGATGTAQKTVSLKLLRGFQVPRVSLARQQLAVTKLNALTEETQRLESIYQQKLAALDVLKKSLLDQAFSGKLTSGGTVAI